LKLVRTTAVDPDTAAEIALKHAAQESRVTPEQAQFSRYEGARTAGGCLLANHSRRIEDEQTETLSPASLSRFVIVSFRCSGKDRFWR
jgi:hypothetical protein